MTTTAMIIPDSQSMDTDGAQHEGYWRRTDYSSYANSTTTSSFGPGGKGADEAFIPNNVVLRVDWSTGWGEGSLYVVSQLPRHCRMV